MGRVKTGKRQKSQQEGGSSPSRFFLISLAIGLALLGWLFWISATNPEVHRPPGEETEIEQDPVEAPGDQGSFSVLVRTTTRAG